MELPSTPTFRLDGKRALVSGASRGLGLAAAVALAEAGAHVVMLARSEESLEEAATALRERGASCEASVLDITDLDAQAKCIEAVLPLDILVNNAGMNRPGPMQSTSVTDFDAVMEINVRATYFLTQAVAKHMLARRRGGSIIFTSSQMGLVGGLDRTVYCASKHAIEGLTKALAIELGPHQIRVNTICPTFIKTPLTASTFANAGHRQWIESKIKLGRIGEVEDIMGAVVFLAADASSLVTGSALVIDGGWTAG